MSKLIPFLVIGIILAACGGMPATEPTQTVPAPEPVGTPTSSASAACGAPSSWAIQYNRSGGFGGFNETLTLNSAGSLKVKSERPPAIAEKTLSESQVNAITQQLVRACPFEVPVDKGNCADCFLYTLSIQMDSRTYTVQATDVTLSEELSPLVDSLNQYLQNSGQ